MVQIKKSGTKQNQAFAEYLAEAPEGCGVYILKDASGRHLYVGKSISIRKRLADHVKAAESGEEKERAVMRQAAAAEYILTANELEALILENTLIKRRRPRYNVVLRDDKDYPYIRVDKREPFSRVTVVRRPKKDGALYFGPYIPARAMRRTLRYLNSIFPVRQCRDNKPPRRSRPCLQFQMGRCLGPCCGKVSEEAYLEVLNDLILFLKGRSTKLRKIMEIRMHEASSAMRFEDAARWRDRLHEMDLFLQRQAVYGSEFGSADIIGLAREIRGWLVYVLLVRHGAVVGGVPHRIHLPTASLETDVLQEFIERYYASRRDIPHEILVPVLPPEAGLLASFLSMRAMRKVTVSQPSRGRGLELLLLARRNALTEAEKGRRVERLPADAEWSDLGLDESNPPRRIEIYDASSIGGTEAVVGMVLWDDGALKKGEYRRFRVKSKPGADDYAMIREALSRRLARIAHGETSAPDLIVVDGGAGHVSAASGVLEAAGREDTALLGIAKGRRRGEPDRIHTVDGRMVDLGPDSSLLKFLMFLRDEVHRLAVTYHRQKRGAAMTRSELDVIPGLGPRRRRLLLDYFGHARGVARATLEDLLHVPGIPEVVARAVYNHYH